MSDSQAYEEVSVAADGVTVIKRFEEDEFPVPAIAFEFASERDEEVTVRLVDQVPEGVAVEDLGFHPEYGSEYWTIDEDEITFERDLEANAEYTSVYGIRATGTDDVEQFLTEPDLADVEPPQSEAEAGDVDDVIPESDDDVVRDVIAGESEEVPGIDEEEADADEDIETLDLADPNAEGEPGGRGDPRAGASDAPDTAEPEESADSAEDDEGEEADAEASGPEADDADEGGAPAVGGDATVVETLAEEIRQNEVSAEDVKLLRQAFEIAGQEGGSIQARLQRVQADVADLRAYTDALEDFLDESGTGQQLIDEVDSFASDLEDIEDSLESMDTRLEDTGEEVSDVQDSIEDLEAAVDDLESQVADEDVADRIEDVEEDITELRDWQEQIKQTFGGG